MRQFLGSYFPIGLLAVALLVMSGIVGHLAQSPTASATAVTANRVHNQPMAVSSNQTSETHVSSKEFEAEQIRRGRSDAIQTIYILGLLILGFSIAISQSRRIADLEQEVATLRRSNNR